MIGTRLGPYRIVEQLGAGGMGEVYRSRDERLGRDVAVKVLPAAVADDPERLARFEREAKALAALSHPNILAIFDFGKEAGITYAVTELLEGETLRQRVTRERMTWRKAIEVAAGVADGLAAAHGKGIIHRDIKPENVFITSDGRVKVLDFGLARLQPLPTWGEATTALSDPGTAAGTVLGTVGYMAPEQVRGQAADARSDIFTLGCLLYEMLTGKRAFARETAAETMTAILKDPAPEVSVSGVEITPELNRIIGHCLEKNPGERFQSASDLAFHLRSLLTGPAQAHPPSGRQDEPARPSTASIAVLPFANLSADPDQEYFCDGMAEEIINALSKVRNLRVAARTSAFFFKGKNADIREIGKKLNVNTILEGSVRRSGSRLRIAAQLINVADGYHIWSERYDRNLEDVFDIQDEISLAIAENLEIRLFERAKGRLIKQPTGDVDAYQLYMKGRFFVSRNTADSMIQAIDCFREAVRRDPSFALAYAGIAESHAWLSVGFAMLPPEAALVEAKEAALKAVEISPDRAETHASLGLVAAFVDWDRNLAARSFSNALALNPDSADVLMWCAVYTIVLEHRIPEALGMLHRAWELNPLQPLIHVWTGWAYLLGRQFDRLIDEAKKLRSLDPHFWVCYHMMGEGYVGKGLYKEAIASYEEAIRYGGRILGNVAELGFAHALEGNVVEATELLNETIEAANKSSMYYGLVGYMYIGLRQYDKAFEWLEKAIRFHDTCFLFLPSIKWPQVETFCREPRFRALLERAGLSHLAP
jgi:serine/threonine protein kinase/tetratricopeptide (TPR) repeat protein